jgi:hypothetical protein
MHLDVLSLARTLARTGFLERSPFKNNYPETNGTGSENGTVSKTVHDHVLILALIEKA